MTGASAVEVVGAVLGLSAAEQDEVWRRWRQGESLGLIARRLGKRGPSVRAFVPQTGGLAVPGHWEGDLVFGKRPGAVGTLVERHSRYVLLVPLADGLTAERVRPALTAAVLRLPEQLRRPLT